MFLGGDIYADVLVAAVTLAVAFLMLRYFKGTEVKDDGKRYPPSLPVLQLFRSILRGGMTVLPEHFMRSAEKLGSIFSIKIAGRMLVVLSDYETIFSAMMRQPETFADRGSQWIEENVINHERRGISFSPYNNTWKKQHKLVLSILKDFGFGFDRVMETRILEEVETMNEEIRKQNGRPMYPKWPFTRSSSNVAMTILFGKNFELSLPKDHSSVIENSSTIMLNIDLTLNMAPVVRFLPTYRRKVNLLQTASEKLLSSIEAGIQFNKSNNSEATFIGRYMELQGADYDHQDLIYIIRDLAFGSVETVSTVLEWAIVELANHPEVQNRLQMEIDEMIPGDRLPSLDDKPRLPYTEAVILEIMRRRTPGPFLVPHATLKDTKLLGYDIPHGCVVIPNAYSAHMDQRFWKDPENFRPERFLNVDNEIINSERVIAFGLGKRSCIGQILGRQATFLFLTSLVQHFDIRPPEGQTSISVKEVIALTMAPSHFEVRLIPRVKPTQNQR